jgi:hypothetical protein
MMKIGAWYRNPTPPALSISGRADLYAFKVVEDSRGRWNKVDHFSARGIYVWRACGVVCDLNSPDNNKEVSSICFYESNVWYTHDGFVEITDRAEIAVLERKLAELEREKKKREAEDAIKWKKQSAENIAETHKALGMSPGISNESTLNLMV